MKKDFPGMLFLVVGNSGSGKDTLIRSIQDQFPPNLKRILVPQRYITRPPSGSESNISISPEKFNKMSNKGKFALEWHIYGLDYGVPKIIEHWLESGHPVIVNVSRTVINDAKDKYNNLKVIFIDVPFEVSVNRLEERGREIGDRLTERIERARKNQHFDAADFIVDNSGDINDTIKALLNYIIKIVKEKNEIE
jgi:ribose 1,5-bisphosphokinase